MRSAAARYGLTAALFALALAADFSHAAPDESNAKARALIDRAIAAMGGKDALLSIKSVHREMKEAWMDVGQGPRPWTGAPDVDHLPTHFSMAVVNFVDYAGRRWFESERFDDGPGDYAVVANAGSQSAGFERVRYTDERPYVRLYPADDIAVQLARRFRRFPEGLLRMALDRADTLSLVNDAANDVASFADPAGNRISFHFDRTTHLLLKSEVERDHAVLGDTTTEAVYADYRKVGAFVLPFVLIDRTAGIPSRKWTVTETRLDAEPPLGAFDAPTDAVAVQSAPAEPKLTALGGGVYEILGPYNVMFAMFSDHVLLVEAPFSEPYVETCLGLIRSVAPGKPIRAVSTHFHYDHIAGARTLIAHGIPIATTPDAVSVIRQAAAAKRVRHPDLLAKTPHAPQLEAIEDKRIFADAAQRVEVYDFGPTPHVAQILVAYFPHTKTLHVADLLDTLTPEMVVPGVDTMAMIKKIKEHRLDVERIVPVHGVPVTIADLNRGLAIRARHVPGTPLDARPSR